MTSPPLVVGDVVVVGALVSDNLRTDAPSGVVRAFDVRTGSAALGLRSGSARRARHAGRRARSARSTGPAPRTCGRSCPATRRSASSTCRPATRRPTTGPRTATGSTTTRARCVALRADTGALAWHFQTVHHDVWDYDVPAQPVLFDFRRRDGPVAALAQVDQDGARVPARPRDRRAALPRRGARGAADRRAGRDHSRRRSRSRPTRRRSTRRSSRPTTPGASRSGTAASARRASRSYRSEGIFTPPSLRGSIEFPGPAGGAELGQRRGRSRERRSST